MKKSDIFLIHFKETNYKIEWMEFCYVLYKYK